MSNAIEGLRRQIGSAQQLQSVVRTMKAMAATSIGQYERSVRALADYSRTVELGLGACLRQREPWSALASTPASAPRAAAVDAPLVGAVVFGSDQGLVGQFNDVVAAHAIERLASLPGARRLWAVGERVHARLVAARIAPVELFAVPFAVRGIVPLVAQVLLSIEQDHTERTITELHLFYNRPLAGSLYAPASRRLLPLDQHWQRELVAQPWPTHNLPQVLGTGHATLRALVSEYLFISLFRACAESLASENASRLAAMERADRNIDELLEGLQASFHQLRQTDIDEELFDLIAGVELLNAAQRPR
jgi:F-type H+-transporting ATPase subunit gamma